MTIENAEGEQETIDSTPEHPFYVEGLGWGEASSLHAGMTIWFANGTKGSVEDISNEGLEEPVTVYNFEVVDFHTYFVGECGILVHNVCATNDSPSSVINDGKIIIEDVQANPQALSGKSVGEIGDALTDAGYDVTIKASTKSRSGAQIIQVNNPGAGRNVSQVQVSPGGGRHGKNPYVKVSTTDQGIIKIIDGKAGDYITDGKETATFIFRPRRMIL